jgi:SH3-like domain-containing protein
MRVHASGLLAALALCAAFFAAPVPARADPVVAGVEHCVVHVRSDDVLNMRAQPGAQAAILTGLRYGQCGVMVTGECRGDWCPVEDGHHAGWAHKHYLATVSPARYCVTGVRGNDLLYMRAYPAPTSRILAGLNSDQCEVALLPYARDGWQKVRAEGWEGWVTRSYLSGQ